MVALIVLKVVEAMVNTNKTTFKQELEQAAKARREKGDCGPYPTGEEYDLDAYDEIAEYLKADPKASLNDVAKEVGICSLGFIAKVQNDIQ